MYGKLAQRKGNGSYANMIWAGLITAQTRSKINAAIAVAGPGNVVMCATDAVYSLRPLDSGLRVGECLGDWELSTLEGLFIVQPGLYWCPEKRKRKSRGLSGKFFEDKGRTEEVERVWSDWLAGENSQLIQDFPRVSVDMQNFIGLKLARARGKPELAGVWQGETRDISFDYRNKRVGHKITGRGIVTKPKLGGRDLWSLPHRDFLAAGGHEPFEQARMIMEEQPDYIDLGPPFQD